MIGRFLVVGLLSLSAACGGKAIIDEPLGGGGANASASQATSASGVLCTTQDPVGDLATCTSLGTTTGGAACSSAICDDDGNRWQSDCEGNTCVCSFNGETRCTCFVEGGTLCTGTIPSCCPEPFPG